MPRIRCFPFLLSLALPLLLLAEPAFAWVGVGPDPSCEVRTIQAAIDRIVLRQSQGDFNDPLIVVASGTFNEALRIDARGIAGSNAVLTITGGYDSGCHAPQEGGISAITAANRSASAMTINGGIALSLDMLQLTGADTGGDGGGIYFDGAGTLDVFRVGIFGNHAAHGGGLYANGRGGNLAIKLHDGSYISNNSAEHAGGGMRIQGQTRLFMLESNTSILNNRVNLNDDDGAGGGLQVVGPALADIGSGVISSNTARYGGGISVHGDDDDGYVRFFMTALGQPTRIEHNVASQTGGGIFLGSSSHFASANTGVACGFGFSISANTAQEGAALYADTSSNPVSTTGASADLSSSALVAGPDSYCFGPEPASVLGALGCQVGVPCNTVNDNRAQDASGQPTDGSTILVQTLGRFKSDRIEMRGNVGAHVFRGFDTNFAEPNTFSNCLLDRNQTTGDFIRTDENGSLKVTNCTLSGNTIGGSNVLSLTGNLTLTDSVLWQPGKTSLLEESPAQNGLEARVVDYVLASETASLGGGVTVFNQDPQFVAPAGGNYRLLPTSPAIDFAPTQNGVDIESRSRTIDLAVPDHPGGGPLDLGAYELQVLPAFPPDEAFDEVTAPALPPGWANTITGTGDGWITRANEAFSAPNAAFTDDTSTPTDKSLTTPAFRVGISEQLSFRHKFELDASPGSAVTFDGVVLEVSIAGGLFQDIFAAGGSFASGGYDHVVSTSSIGNPLSGRNAWGGTSNGYQDVVVNLPGVFNDVAVRWRMGTDAFAGGTGYSLDDVHLGYPITDRILSDGFECRPGPSCP